MTGAVLDDAERDLAAKKLDRNRLDILGKALGVPCTPEQDEFLRALAAAIASFEMQTLPFTNEVDGKLDDQTARFLAMVYPSTREREHPCHGAWLPPAEPVLSTSQVSRAIEQGLPRSETWVRELRGALGETANGLLDAPTVQRIASFQRIMNVIDPSIRPTGILDEATIAALERAYPRLAKREPSPAASIGYLPACVAQWQGATKEERTFMMRVYEAQRIWSAQRREFAGQMDAAPIEEGRSARRDAAIAAKKLLAAARSSTIEPASSSHGGDLQVVFGYRSAAAQVTIWEYHFPARYAASKGRRETLPGGPHGHAAVVQMAEQYAARTAAPGYSLHNRGVAIDFACVTPSKKLIRPTGAFLSGWAQSWCLKWLQEHASEFGFHPNKRINEPWHWEFHDPALVRAEGVSK